MIDHECDSIRFSTDDYNGTTNGQFQRESFKSKSGLQLLRTVEYMSYPNISRREMYEIFIPLFKTGRIHIESITREYTEKDNGRTLRLAIYDQPQRARAEHLNGRESMCVKYPMEL